MTWGTIDANAGGAIRREDSVRLLSMFFVAACIVCLWVYRRALDGPFISDDSFFVTGLARDYPLDLNFVVDAFRPSGELKYEMMSYAPLYLLTSRIEWAAFGGDTLGYHVVNVIVHSANATLLVALMRNEGIDAIWAVIGGAFYALHPANVEAVAWISQLRSLLAVSFALGSLIALRRRPGLAAGLFAASLLFKISAVFALPIAAGLYWSARNHPQREPVSLAWLCVWFAAFAFCAYPAFYSTSLGTTPAFESTAELFRNIAANGARYMLMATTSIGVSAFHMPPPVRSWSNSWWIASVPIGLVLSWRVVDGVVHRRDEVAWWLGAGTAFIMVSQIFPFYFVVADRYLYFILPGLLVASLLWWGDIKRLVGRRFEALQSRVPLAGLGVRVAIVLLLVLFAVRSGERAELWKNEDSLTFESAINYPAGATGNLVRGLQLLGKGDLDGAFPELREVVNSGHHQYIDLFALPGLAPYLQDKRIVRLRHRVARLTIEQFEGDRALTQHQMRSVGSAHFYIGDYDSAITVLEDALRRGGPHREAILADLELIRRTQRDRG